MKKSIYLIIIAFVISNCVCVYNKIPKFNNIYDAATWVYKNIEYKNDIDVWGRSEFWQISITTIALMTGDCEDRSILLKDIVFEQFGIKMDLLDLGTHIATIYNNEVYDSWKIESKNISYVKCMTLDRYLSETKYVFRQIIQHDNINKEIVKRNVSRIK
jgi:hypothetical protein